MKGPIHIGQNIAVANLLEYAEKVVTEDGKEYYRFPYWFEKLEGNFEFVIHTTAPKDLSEFLTKAGLGEPNPQIEKAECNE